MRLQIGDAVYRSLEQLDRTPAGMFPQHSNLLEHLRQKGAMLSPARAQPAFLPMMLLGGAMTQEALAGLGVVGMLVMIRLNQQTPGFRDLVGTPPLPMHEPDDQVYLGPEPITARPQVEQVPMHTPEDVREQRGDYTDGLGDVPDRFETPIAEDTGIYWMHRSPHASNPDHGYHNPPKELPGFPEANRVRQKSERRRWKLPGGEILEWDYQHGEIEKYNKRGRHLGAFDFNTGEQLKEADLTRKIEP